MSTTDPSVLAVLGATTEIGRTVARRYGHRGWRIACLETSRGTSDRDTARKTLDDALVETVNMADEDNLRKTWERVAEWSHGRLDVLLNAPGRVQGGRFEHLSLLDHRAHLDANLWSPLAVTHAAFPLLRDTEGARVVNIASASSMYGRPDLASYSASKAGVRALTQALNLEWARHDIHVCDVIPPYVTSNSPSPKQSPADSSASQEPPRRQLAPEITVEDVADVVDQALVDDKIHWPVGKQFRWIYRLSDVLPAPLVRLLMRYVSGF